MPLLVDFTAETATNPGTGTTVNLGGAINGSFRTFIAAFGNGGRCFYTISDEAGARESGIGTVHSGSPNTLTRDTVKSNSAGTLVRLNFTGPVFVFNWLPATQAVYKNELDQTQIGSGTINTNQPGVGNAQLVAGTAAIPGYVEFLDASGARAGFAGFGSGTHLVLSKGGSFTGWLIDGDLVVGNLATFNGGLNVGAGSVTLQPGSNITVLSGAVNVGGQVLAQTGRLTFGAFGSLDANRVCILSDFNNFNASNYTIWRAPDGQLHQTGPATTSVGNDLIPFGTAFPNVCTYVGLSIYYNFAATPVIASVTSTTGANFTMHTLFWNGTTWQIATTGILFRYFATGY